MITNLDKPRRKDDMKLLTAIIFGFLLLVWLCSPPGNKFLQVCFWGNNTRLVISKIMNTSKATEYKFHRKNAIYLAKMYPSRMDGVREMDRAIATLPSYATDGELKSLYRDRAEIKLFLGDKTGALSDFMNSGTLNFNDNYKVAMLFSLAGNNKEAISYCHAILNADPNAYSGFSCYSNIYVSVGRPDIALRLWDLAIDRNKNNPRAYVDRAVVKKSMGDLAGYEEDIQRAKQYSPTIDLAASFYEDMMNPKVLTLTVR